MFFSPSPDSPPRTSPLFNAATGSAGPSLSSISGSTDRNLKLLKTADKGKAVATRLPVVGLRVLAEATLIIETTRRRCCVTERQY
jgi:hypothetical protein